VLATSWDGLSSPWSSFPAYFRGEIYTSYELLQKRFGGAVRAVSGRDSSFSTAPSATAYACMRRPWSWPWPRASRSGGASWGSALAMILYTEEGGVVATIWTDSIQMFVYLAGAIVCLVAVIHRLPEGGVGAAMAAASAAGKLALFDFSLDFRCRSRSGPGSWAGPS
jgi:Na+/proline symporter